jgi:hypothetical protein
LASIPGLHKGLKIPALVSSTCHSRPSEQFSESQAAFGTTFRVTGGNLKSGTSFLKRVTGMISEIVSNFNEASININFSFLHKKGAKYCKNHQR